jgi:fermentation-respiration switch protein FrsA (DUF1100 family)
MTPLPATRKTMSLNSLLYVLLVVVMVYCALILYLLVMQPKLIYLPDMPTRTLQATPQDIGLDYETVRLETADGEQLHGWYVAAQNARATLLFCHGNAGNISHRLESLRIYHELGLNVLIFDYRGYGLSTGKASEAGTYRDADAAWRYLLDERGLAPQDIVIAGRSLGAAVAADLASRAEPAAVVLELAFMSVPAMAAEIYPWLPPGLPGLYRYDTRAKLAQIKRPLLIVHSRDDEIIPYAHAETLYAEAARPKQLLELQGGHNDAMLASRAGYVHGLEQFLVRHVDRAAAVAPVPAIE